LAILTALTLRAVFRLAYRQTEGLIGSIISLLGLTVDRPPRMTLPRSVIGAKVRVAAIFRLPPTRASTIRLEHAIRPQIGLVCRVPSWKLGSWSCWASYLS
jgi:hypothetical protein